MIKKITCEEVRSLWPVRPQDANKGSFGRVLVVAGSRTMCGAGFLCAKSALLSGAGLVFWALPKSMQPSFAAALPEVITLPLAETDSGELAVEAFDELQSFCSKRKLSLAVTGSGMGTSPLLSRLLAELDLPLVADADALNCLAAQNRLSLHRQPVIYTPHAGEMARLLKTDIARDEKSREQQVQTLSRQTGGVCLLKGAGTLVCRSLSNESFEMRQNTTGGPALAKAGTGDVLAGVIAGLWAQLGRADGFDLQSAFSAAVCGVYVHGLAGDLAARKLTDGGVLATDVAEHLPYAAKEILN
ncbi:MAG: NAD(P)H-hydrate dehydratase [Candidatus Avelusimicrobium sp.]|uniref:NAD(P)H-hydrate dehydratase n=1 Tax=Candidatus Avelusimicrobium sp. TaxID=3048833 RepID=UPI003EFFC973